MRRWLAIPLVLAAAVGLCCRNALQALAQKDGPVQETIYTADGVELHGLFHPATKNVNNPKDTPVVVFLYPPGPDRDMTKGDWGGLAKRLNEEGYHVFQFDWRGHGKSTNIKDKQKFWTNTFLNSGATNFNGMIKGGPPKQPLKNDIFYKDLGRPERYMPAYLNDLAAVRLYLDIKNDKSDLNSSSIFVVGAGDAAAIGMAWITSEWKRPADMPGDSALGINVGGYDFVPQPLAGGVKTEAGTDIAAAAWLTPSKPASFPSLTVQRWITNPAMAPKLRENNPMLFLYAEKDSKGKTDSEFYYKQVLVADPPKGATLGKLDQTFIKDVKGGEQLQGVKLLGQDGTLKTETTVVQFFAAIKKARANLAWKSRGFKNPYFIDLRYFGLQP